MALSHTTPDFQKILRSYPFPIAFILEKEVLGATTPRDQAEGLIRLANTALQYTALVAASNYAAASFKDSRVSWSFERLKRPLVSAFAEFPRVAVPVLEKENALFVPEFASALAKANSTEVSALRMGEHGFEERKLPLVEALVNLRNALSHDKYRGHWDKFVENHASLVLQFLQTMDWCSQYPLIRSIGDGQWARLMGSNTAFPTEMIANDVLNEVVRAKQEDGSTSLLLANPNVARFLPLYPFIIWSDCPFCKQEPLLGMIEEVFLFNGDEGKKFIAYVGVRHPRPMSLPKSRMDAIYDEKKVPPEPVKVAQLTYLALNDRALRQSEIWLRENITARRYIPQVCYPRKEMEAHLETFLQNRKTGFVLLGEAGMGKTNLLCRKIEEWRACGEIVVFYAGHQISAESSFEDRILRDLNLTGCFPELLAFLHTARRRLIVIVDGVNEHEKSPSLLREMCNFTVRSASSVTSEETSLFKVILSFRSNSFEKTLHSLFAAGGDEASLFPSSAFETRVETHAVGHQSYNTDSYRFTLERVGANELEPLYESYRVFKSNIAQEGQGTCFCPQTSFASLSASVRSVLTHPWYLRMAMEIFNGTQIPSSLWTGEILEAFCNIKIFGHTPDGKARFQNRALVVEELVKLMRRQNKTAFYRDDLHDLSSFWSRVLLENEPARSPILQLLDESVLMEVAETRVHGSHTRTRYLLRFAFDPLFEYLLAQNLLQHNGGWDAITGDYLVSLLEHAKEFDPIEGAVAEILSEAVQERKFEVVLDAIVKISAHSYSTATISCCGAVINSCARSSAKREARIGTHLCRIEAEIQMSLKLAEVGFFKEADRCISATVSRCRRFTDKKEAGFRRLLARALWIKGIIQRDQATNDVQGIKDRGQRRLLQAVLQSAAIDCYNEVLQYFKDWPESDGRVDSVWRASVLLEKGSLLSGHVSTSDDYVDEARHCLKEAVTICRQAIETEYTPEKARTLAKALACLGRISKDENTLEFWNEAISILRRLCETEGRADYERDLAYAIMYKNSWLISMGKWDDVFMDIPSVDIPSERASEWVARMLGGKLRSSLDKRVCLEVLRKLTERICLKEDVVEELLKCAIRKEQIACTAELVNELSARFQVVRLLEDWGAAARDVGLAVEYAKIFGPLEALPQPLKDEWQSFIQQVCSLNESEKINLYSSLGGRAVEVKKIMYRPDS